jgi:drug/metabolite transporter (DMT)-like permease
MTGGIACMLLSALFFAASTVFAKFVNESSNISAFEITFFRFIIGFAVMAVYVVARKKNLAPKNANYVVLRSVFNTAAVIFFYLGIKYTTVSNSNLLNMTYPVFVMLISPFLNREKSSGKYYIYLLIALVGSGLVVIRDPASFEAGGINIGDAFSLASAVLAAFAVSTLRESRKYDETYIILFYLMALGSAFNLFFIIGDFIVPRGMVLFHVLMSGITAFAGQIFITAGYRYISASGGAIVSSSRILFAMGMGVMFFNDPITTPILIGAFLIFASTVGVGLMKNEGSGIHGRSI